ncbi:hypothetical protein AB6A40_006623 [Gnathostoma spinigerum]|uniref:Uncharacterized protein n=1 Tax=Gnathostoma spinigerum TaxID=75299 RepID=A0ABD6EP33_9BILA
MAEEDVLNSAVASSSSSRPCTSRSRRRRATTHGMVLRKRSNSHPDLPEPPSVSSLSPTSALFAFQPSAAASVNQELPNFKRYALRKRRSLQQKDEEGCVTSSMAATADEVQLYNY